MTEVNNKTISEKSLPSTILLDEKDNKEKTENELRQEEYDLHKLDKKFLYEFMAVPSYSGYEYRMVTYIILWARKNNIKYEFDDYGNVYLTKGTLDEGEFYPCLTAHLDTVQQKHKAYILAGAELDLKTRINKGKHEVYVDGMGIGADDKGAIFISLSMFSHFDKLKAAFFLEEETGCKGSLQMNESFFDDVSYVLGFDSPELNRAAWKCSGTKIFTADFYKTYIKDVATKWGVTKFYSEPFTDVKQITEKTGLMCMNFGNGGYKPHMPDEYIIIEELDNALAMGIELVETIDCKIQHKLKSFTWEKDEKTGELKKSEIDVKDDEDYLRSLGDYSSYSSNYGSYNYYNYNNPNYNYWEDKNSTNNTNKKDTENSGTTTKIDYESIKYVVDTYDSYIENVKKNIQSICKERGIDFNETFESAFSKEIVF